MGLSEPLTEELRRAALPIIGEATLSFRPTGPNGNPSTVEGKARNGVGGSNGLRISPVAAPSRAYGKMLPPGVCGWFGRAIDEDPGAILSGDRARVWRFESRDEELLGGRCILKS